MRYADISSLLCSIAQEGASPASPASSSVTVWLLCAQGGAAENQRQYDEATSLLSAVYIIYSWSGRFQLARVIIHESLQLALFVIA